MILTYCLLHLIYSLSSHIYLVIVLPIVLPIALPIVLPIVLSIELPIELLIELPIELPIVLPIVSPIVLPIIPNWPLWIPTCAFRPTPHEPRQDCSSLLQSFAPSQTWHPARLG